MTHDTDFAEAALPDLFSHFGQAATYRAVDRRFDDRSLTVMAGRERMSEQDSSTGVDSERVRDITIMRDSASEFGGVADPQHADEIELSDVTWVVRHWVAMSDDFATLTCVRGEARHVGSSGSYGKAAG